MTRVKQEVADFIRYSDVLLHRESTTSLTETEKHLLEAYIVRLCDQLKLSVDCLNESRGNGHKA